MNRILLFVLSFIPSIANAQNIIDERAALVTKEGKTLYRLEMSAWEATDIFLQLGHKENAGGYFSYCEGENTKCIFYSKEDSTKAIATIVFDGSFKSSKATTDFSERPLTEKESLLARLRRCAIREIEADTFFRRYNDMRLNIIPLMNAGTPMVYLTTGPQKDGVVVFGNDYLLTYNGKFNCINKERIHNSILPMEYAKMKNAKSGFHSHVLKQYPIISATDICTLMLYEKYTTWKQYYVISGDYVSIWGL